MRHYHISELAESDLVSIWEYIADENLTAADAMRERFFEAFDKIAAMPEMGHQREDLTSRPVRFWAVASYLIIYNSTPNPIEIVRVLSGWRDVAALLR